MAFSTDDPEILRIVHPSSQSFSTLSEISNHIPTIRYYLSFIPFVDFSKIDPFFIKLEEFLNFINVDVNTFIIFSIFISFLFLFLLRRITKNYRLKSISSDVKKMLR